ncbi:MAG: hypothetical protein ACLU4P_01715 [Ruminococcus sp.]
MQNDVLPYLQSFCSLEEKCERRRERRWQRKMRAREAIVRLALKPSGNG